MNVIQLCYLPFWYLKNVIGKKHQPLVTVIAITDVCNLRCKHCSSEVHACKGHKSYEQIKKELLYTYRLGARFIDFEGGEPTLWKDGDKNLNDLYALAKEIGFFSSTLTTNAQQDFSWTKADSTWVSVDGYRGYHDLVRGEGAWDKMVYNIEHSGLKNITINMVINNINVDSVRETIEFAKSNPAISQISLNFITPYPGLEDLMLPWEKRREVLDMIIALKKQGYPIMNSISGLEKMKTNKFKRACWISNFIVMDGTNHPQCPGYSLGICDKCGFCMAGEMASVLEMRPDTILSGLKLRM